jgi:hypothetical protein
MDTAKQARNVESVLRKSMYTPLEEAKEEVWKRWNDADLRQSVLEYVGELPEGFGQEPRAFLVRNLVSQNLEFQTFTEKCKSAGLKPVCTHNTRVINFVR